MTHKIIVAGGGHGGIAAAALLASNGFDVTVYEKNTRKNMGYDWTDIFDKKGFTEAGMELPDSALYGYKNNMTFRSPDMKSSLTQHTPADQLELQMERRDIYDHIISHAEKQGVKFVFGVSVLGPVMNGSRVTGIKTDSGEIGADLVIDACGIDSPVRSNLPAYLGIQNRPGRYEQFFVYRAFYERTGDIPEENFNVLLLHNGCLGISWVAIEEEHTDVLIGRFNPLTQKEVDAELVSLRSEFGELGEKKLRGGQFVKIPVRRPLGVMIADGYAAIGDSAFMTVPLIGSGIANSMKAAKILADTVIADTNGEYSFSTLLPYQKNFYKKLGAGLAPIELVKLMLTKISAEDVNSLFANRVLNEEDVTMGADTTSIWALLHGLADIGELPVRAKALTKDPVLLCKIAKVGIDIARASAVCAALPACSDAKSLKKWADKYNKIFS